MPGNFMKVVTGVSSDGRIAAEEQHPNSLFYVQKEGIAACLRQRNVNFDSPPPSSGSSPSPSKPAAEGQRAFWSRWNTI